MKKIFSIGVVFMMLFSASVPVSASTTVNTTSGYSYRLFPNYTLIKVPDSVSYTNEIVIKHDQGSTETNRQNYAGAVIELQSNELLLANHAGAAVASAEIPFVLAASASPAAIAGLLATLGYSKTVQDYGVEIKKYQNYANLYFNALYPYREIAPDPTCYFSGYNWLCPLSSPLRLING